MDWKELQAPAKELQSIWFQGLSACAENNVSVQQQCKQSVGGDLLCLQQWGRLTAEKLLGDSKGFPGYCQVVSIY